VSAIKDHDVPQSAGKMIEMLVADHETARPLAARHARSSRRAARPRHQRHADVAPRLARKGDLDARALDAGYEGGAKRSALHS
jgi:hypothetical protein